MQTVRNGFVFRAFVARYRSPCVAPDISPIALAVLFLALHLPFLPRSLEDLDSINFALGLRHFDVALHQPHPPGYPVYIAAGKLVHAAGAGRGQALGLLSNVAGALGVWSLIALFTRIDVAWPRRWAVVAALLTVTCPLYWLTAARPLSDVPGLAAALAIQALLLAVSSDGGIIAASFLAALAAGIRSQVAWLTLPLLVLVVLRQRTVASAGRARVMRAPRLLAGCAVWAVPLVVVTRRTFSLLARAVRARRRGSDRHRDALDDARRRASCCALCISRSWLPGRLADGASRPAVCRRRSCWTCTAARRPSLWVLVLAFGPYLVFDVLFQETFTSRYALPLVPPIAYLAIRAVASLPRTGGLIVAAGDRRPGGHHRRRVGARVFGDGGARVPDARRHARRRDRTAQPSARPRPGHAPS